MGGIRRQRKYDKEFKLEAVRLVAEVITASLIERNVTDDDNPLYLSRHLDAVCTIHFVSDLPGAANSP